MHTGRHSEEAKLFASISCRYCMKLKQHFHYQFSIFTSFDETIQAYILYTTMHWFENLQKRCTALINFWRLDCSRTIGSASAGSLRRNEAAGPTTSKAEAAELSAVADSNTRRYSVSEPRQRGQHESCQEVSEDVSASHLSFSSIFLKTEIVFAMFFVLTEALSPLPPFKGRCQTLVLSCWMSETACSVFGWAAVHWFHNKGLLSKLNCNPPQFLWGH